MVKFTKLRIDHNLIKKVKLLRKGGTLMDVHLGEKTYSKDLDGHQNVESI